MKKEESNPCKSDIQRHQEMVAYYLACLCALMFILAIVAAITAVFICIVLQNVIHLQP